MGVYFLQLNMGKNTVYATILKIPGIHLLVRHSLMQGGKKMRI